MRPLKTLASANRSIPPAQRRFLSKERKQLQGNVIDTLESRGFVAALTHNQLRDHVKRQTTIYAGIDPSAASLHVGNLVALMGLLHWRLAGHNVLALVGGATGSIGDPSGRSTERTALAPAVLAQNVAGITAQVHRFFSNGDAYLARQRLTKHNHPGSVTVVNNHDWTRNISLLDFLRDVGKLAKVNTMIARDSVRTRLDSEYGISFTEFSYQLLQAHDFAHLHKEHGCRVQLGGSDQWGNIVAGIDLIKRQSSRDQEAFGLTLPLLTTESGEKFGKSAGNAVWLDGQATSVYDFYQFFYRLPDSSVEQQLKLFTLLSLEEIAEIMDTHSRDKWKRHAQKTLAEHVTELIHGHNNLARSLRVTELLYHVPLTQYKSEEVLQVLGPEPFFHRVKWADIKGLPVAKLMVQFGMVKSRMIAKSLIDHKSVTLNGWPLKDPRDAPRVSIFIDKHLLVIKIGKSQHLILYVDTE